MQAQARLRAEAVALFMAGLLGIVAFASPAFPETDVDLRAAYYTDMEAFGVGGGLLMPVSSTGPWYFNPNAEMAFGDDVNLVTLNGDFHYDFASSSNASFWLGAGPALLFTNPDFGDSDTDFGVNVLAGVGALRGQVRPFGQLRGVLADDSELVLQGGVRF